MFRRIFAILSAIVLLSVSLSAAAEEREITGPVAKTVEELNAMLESSESGPPLQVVV